jgi:hypothetical protein
MKRKLLIAVCALVIGLQLKAQDDIPPAPTGGSDIANIDPQAMLADSISSIKAAFGITNIGGETFAGFRFQPEFRIGKIAGFGLDIPVQFNVDTW